MPNITLIILKNPCYLNSCHHPPPPPPPHHHSLPPLVLVMICTLAASVSLLCYIAIIKACRTFRNRSRTTTHATINVTNETHQDFVDEEHGSIVFHPIWLINTIGLDQSVIDSIGVFKYKKGNGFMDDGSDSDCAVCLGEFQDEESLRILPKCNHAFHVSCIDTWLRSHKNCPVCRAPVVKITIMDGEIESNTRDEIIPIGDLGNETGNTREIDRSLEDKCLFEGVRVQSDLMDHRRRRQEPETMRRSVSMVQLTAGGNGDQESKKKNLLQKNTNSVQNRSFQIRGDVKSESL